jgi:hypothetical protein
MSAEKSLSVPTIRVNSDVVAIVPNTFSYKEGTGEVTVRTASAGGGNVSAVHTQNAETMFSTCKFNIYPTAANLERIRDWKNDIGGNTVEAIQRGDDEGIGDIAIAFKNMSVTNDPDIAAGADTDITIEMAGDKVE